MEKARCRRLNVKVSVIIPIYNMEKYINECIDSVLNQNLNDIEVILVDDGSTDSSPQICDFYKKDKRVVVIHQVNGGLSNARNSGMKVATGEYIMFLDADDYLAHESCIEDLYMLARENNLEILHYSADIHYDYQDDGFTKDRYRIKITNDSTLTGLEMFSLLWESQSFSSSACMHLLKNEFLKANNINFYDGILHEDNIFTMECLVKAKKVKFIDNPIYIRRVREGSIMTSKKSFSNVYGFFVCYIKILELLKDHNVEQSIEPNEQIRNSFESILFVIRNNALEYLKDLTKREIEHGAKKMNEYERVYFKHMFLDKMNDKNIVDEAQIKINKLEKENMGCKQQLKDIIDSKRWKLLNKILLIKDRL